MCSPLAVGGAAVNVFSQLAQFKAQQAQAQAETDAWKSGVKSAGKSLNDQTTQEGVRLQQEYESGVEKQLALRREALQAKGTAIASGESGGLSEEMLLEDFDRQKATYTDAVATNMKNQAQQSYWTKQGMLSDAQSRANSTRPTSTGGNSLALGLGVIGAGLDAYNDYHIKKSGDIKSAKK